MNSDSEAFEIRRFVYILVHIFIGIPMNAWKFIVWGVNVFILRKRPNGKFPRSLSFLGVSPAIGMIRNESAGWMSLNIIYNW